MLSRISIVVGCLLLMVVSAGAKDLPVNEQIMYGGVEVTDGLLKANEVFLQKVDETGVGRADASDQFAKLGWQAFGAGDISTASKRFNQAWLLNPENPSAYWAFGIIAYDRDNRLDFASKMFDKALSLKEHSTIYSDYGRIYERAGQPEKAIELFMKGLELNSKEKGCYIGLMRAYDDSNDWKTVRHWLDKGEEQEVFSPEEMAKYTAWINESERIQ